MLCVLHSDDPQAQPVLSRDEIEGALKKSQQDTSRLETELDTLKKEADRLETELDKLKTLNAQLNSEKSQQSATETQVL